MNARANERLSSLFLWTNDMHRPKSLFVVLLVAGWVLAAIGMVSTLLLVSSRIELSVSSSGMFQGMGGPLWVYRVGYRGDEYGICFMDKDRFETVVAQEELVLQYVSEDGVVPGWMIARADAGVSWGPVQVYSDEERDYFYLPDSGLLWTDLDGD